MCLVLVFAVFTSFALKASHAPFGCPRPGYWIMTVTGDHCCRCTLASGATFPMALHSMACWATLGSSVGSLQQQSVVSDPVKCGALRNQKRSLGQKQSSETLHAPVGSSSFFQGDDFSHFTCTVWFIEKGRRSWFVELLRALAPPCLEAHAPYLQAPRPASLSSWQLFCWMGLFSPFVISWSCGIFNRLHHFGVTLYWDGQLRSINYILRKMTVVSQVGEEATESQKHVSCAEINGCVGDVQAPSARALSPCRVKRLRAGKLLAFAGACLVSFYCFRNLLPLQSGSPVCCLFSVYMIWGGQRRHFNYILSRVKA